MQALESNWPMSVLPENSSNKKEVMQPYFVSNLRAMKRVQHDDLVEVVVRCVQPDIATVLKRQAFFKISAGNLKAALKENSKILTDILTMCHSTHVYGPTIPQAIKALRDVDKHFMYRMCGPGFKDMEVYGIPCRCSDFG